MASSQAMSTVTVLERDTHLQKIDRLLSDAAQGRGHVVFIGGEAGVGKTTLVETFSTSISSDVRVLRGACDPLSTPQPLGPLIDIANQAGGDLRRTLARFEQRSEIFHTFLRTLANSSRPMLVVIEDAHWADEATLDLLRFIGRRIARTAALLLITYRDDEVGSRHPLRLVLGDLATIGASERLSIPRLSPSAVATLAAASTIDPLALYQQTGGNPFFVSEVLATGGHGIPQTVSDAVLARAARLSPDARTVLDAAAVIGATIEPGLLEDIIGPNVVHVDACVDAGMLRSGDGYYAFRHELAREALLAALEPSRRAALHRAVLMALREEVPGSDMFARLAHHAEAAGEREAVLEYAPRAAERAIALRAHREAVGQYDRVLRFAAHLPPTDRATLLEAYAYECYLIDQISTALAARQEALSIWRECDDRKRAGDNLRWVSRLHWFLGQKSEADTAGREAIAILESLGSNTELARAYSNLAQLRMLAFNDMEAIDWAQRAMELAERLGDTETLLHARNNIGAARLHRGIEVGWDDLEASLAGALEQGFEEHAARAWINLASNAVIQFKLDLADQYLDAGIAYCIGNDLDSFRLYLQGWQAVAAFYRGRWTEAADIAEVVHRSPGVSPVSEIQSLVVRGRIRARRGDPDADIVLATALKLAEPSGELQRIGPVRVSRAEAAWLTGNIARTRAEAQSGYDVALPVRDAWLFGDLAWWLWRSGGLDTPPLSIAEPYQAQVTGDWRAAAAYWYTRDCPYEAASALAELDDESSLREALTVFKHLGAQPMVAEVTRRMRQIGARGITRGPRAATRSNPAALTPRELEVLLLLSEGLRNADIAKRLYLSPKTVDHHVSAVLAKLGASTRTEAVSRAAELGIPLNR
jgi:DNA-binding CsgD family transcriptional regulator